MRESGSAAGTNAGNAGGAERFSAIILLKETVRSIDATASRDIVIPKKRGSGLQLGDPWHLCFKATVKRNHSEGFLKAYRASSQPEETLRCDPLTTSSAGLYLYLSILVPLPWSTAMVI